MRPTTSAEVLNRIQSGELIAPDTGALQPAPKSADATLEETEVESLQRRHKYLETQSVFIRAFDLLRENNVSVDEFYDWASRRIESENTEHFRLLRARLVTQGLIDDEEADPKTVRLAVLKHQREVAATTPIVEVEENGVLEDDTNLNETENEDGDEDSGDETPEAPKTIRRTPRRTR